MWAFVAKETADVARQPRLLVTLVFGPFFVLAAFGIGLSDGLPSFRTVFVTSEGSEVERTVARYGPELASYVRFEGVMTDEAAAIRRLRAGEVDVVAIMPDDPMSYLERNRRAVIVVLHDAVDPIVAAAVEGAARLAADEINRKILSAFVATGQRTGGELSEVLPSLRSAFTAARAAVAAGDRAGGERIIAGVDRELRRVVEDAGIAALAVGVHVGGGPADGVGDALSRVREDGAASDGARLQQLEAADRAVAELQDRLAAFASVRPEVVVRPFTAHTRSLAPIGSATSFYLPSMVALLIQHLGVTFAALSMVRERELGAVELFSVAPVSAVHILLGKCLAYVLLGAGLCAVLVASLRATIGYPLGGDLIDAALVDLLVLLASVGIGMLVAQVSRSDSQAVQLSMLLLLGGFFFSGFFLSNGRLGEPAATLGRLLPATHGTELSRDVLLRGRSLEPTAFVPLVAMALVTLLLAVTSLRRQLRRR